MAGTGSTTSPAHGKLTLHVSDKQKAGQLNHQTVGTKLSLLYSLLLWHASRTLWWWFCAQTSQCLDNSYFILCSYDASLSSRLSSGDSVLEQASTMIYSYFTLCSSDMHHWAVDSLVVILCSNKPVPVLKQASALITPILFFAPMTHHWAVDSLEVILCSNKPVPW